MRNAPSAATPLANAWRLGVLPLWAAPRHWAPGEAALPGPARVAGGGVRVTEAGQAHRAGLSLLLGV